MITRQSTQTNVVAGFISKVYAWMFAALAITASSAVVTVSNPAIFNFVFGNKFVFYGIMLAQLGLVITLSAAINKLSPWAARAIFVLYSSLLGVLCSSLFFVFELNSIMAVFGTTCAMFAVMAIYGYTTKADLTTFGSILSMGLLGIIIASIINMFVGSPTAGYVISFLGVVIFTGLIAFDMQKIKHFAEQLRYYDREQHISEGNVALLCALTLYLDFVNLFLMLLQLTGQRRRD